MNHHERKNLPETPINRAFVDISEAILPTNGVM
jgi:hypothetical protein